MVAIRILDFILVVINYEWGVGEKDKVLRDKYKRVLAILHYV